MDFVVNAGNLVLSIKPNSVILSGTTAHYQISFGQADSTLASQEMKLNI
jgi:hypothetical protein